jgi:hypothetical protein
MESKAKRFNPTQVTKVSPGTYNTLEYKQKESFNYG